MFSNNTKDMVKGETVLFYGDYVMGGTAIEAWDNDGPYAVVSINVPEIPCKENQIVLNHDILFDKKFVEGFKKYIVKDSVPVSFGPFGVRSELVTLKDNWKELCIPMI